MARSLFSLKRQYAPQRILLHLVRQRVSLVQVPGRRRLRLNIEKKSHSSPILFCNFSSSFDLSCYGLSLITFFFSFESNDKDYSEICSKKAEYGYSGQGISKKTNIF